MNWNIEHMNSWWEGGDSDPPLMRASTNAAGRIHRREHGDTHAGYQQ
jgi:hypothetical protein